MNQLLRYIFKSMVTIVKCYMKICVEIIEGYKIGWFFNQSNKNKINNITIIIIKEEDAVDALLNYISVVVFFISNTQTHTVFFFFFNLFINLNQSVNL